MDHSTVGVAILTCNDWARTLSCLEAVHRQTIRPRRIVVCDNGYDNETADRILAGWRAARSGWSGGAVRRRQLPFTFGTAAA